MTPYLAFWLPAQLGGSGVLATVAAGLYVSWNGPRLISAATRLQGIFFWDLTVYMVEGFVFLLTGLQARTLIGRMDGGFPIREALITTGLVTVVIILARFVWVFPAVYLPRLLFPPLARRDPSPPWTWAFTLAFTGVRGVVSLAAALAIPFTLASGAPFPDRNLILFVTFGVIIITLIGQGSLLPTLIRWLNLGKYTEAERQREHAAELAARLDAIGASERRLMEIAAERDLSAEATELLRERHSQRRHQFPSNLNTDGIETARKTAALRLELIAIEREFLHQALREGRITDELRRRIERELDLEEAAIACKEEGDDPPL